MYGRVVYVMFILCCNVDKYLMKERGDIYHIEVYIKIIWEEFLFLFYGDNE